jgi:hypothetical protein
VANDYKAQLEQFFALVPKLPAPSLTNKISGTEYYGEVQSGTPIISIPNKAALPAAKELIEKASVVENPKFETLTGLTHRKLLDNGRPAAS